MFKLQLALIVLFSSSSSYASDLCIQYMNYIPLPSWFSGLCNGNNSSVGGAFATYADAFSLNPAAIPTVELPLGAELGYSTPTKTGNLNSKFNFSLLKGFNGFGLGLASDSDDSIYSNRSIRSATNFTDTLNKNFLPQNETPSLNFALGIRLPENLPQLGLQVRYDKNYQTLSPGFGTSFHFFVLSLGASILLERENEFFSSTTVTTLNLGAKLLGVQIEATRILTSPEAGTPTSMRAPTRDSNATILSASTNIVNFTLSGALRKTNTADLKTETLYHGGIRYQFTQFANFAYFYNYIPGYHSLSLQIFI